MRLGSSLIPTLGNLSFLSSPLIKSQIWDLFLACQIHRSPCQGRMTSYVTEVPKVVAFTGGTRNPYMRDLD